MVIRGIWAALAEQQPLAKVHRCGSHKIVNFLDAILKKNQMVEPATALILKVLQIAGQIFRRLNAPEFLPTVHGGMQYVDGVRKAPPR